jgi:hypothetical protein
MKHPVLYICRLLSTIFRRKSPKIVGNDIDDHVNEHGRLSNCKPKYPEKTADLSQVGLCCIYCIYTFVYTVYIYIYI